MIRRLLQGEKGTSAIEFALVAPVLIYLFMGVIEFGRYTYYAVLASHAARAAVAYGAQNVITAKNTSAMASVALSDGQSLSNWSGSSGSINAQYVCSVGGAALSTCPLTGAVAPTNTVYYVEVTVTGTFNTLLPYPGLPNSVPVTGSATMRIAGQ